MSGKNCYYAFCADMVYGFGFCVNGEAAHEPFTAERRDIEAAHSIP